MPWPHDGWWWRIIQHIDTSVMRLLPLTGTKVNSLFVWNGNALASFAWLAVLLSISTMCIPAAHRATSFSPSSHTDAHVSCSPKQTKFRLMNMYIFFSCVCAVCLYTFHRYYAAWCPGDRGFCQKQCTTTEKHMKRTMNRPMKGATAKKGAERIEPCVSGEEIPTTRWGHFQV